MIAINGIIRRDFGLFLIANIFNILTAFILFARPMNLPYLGFVGLVWVGMIAVVGAAIIMNYLDRRKWWMIVLPMIFLVFLVLEVTFDYILNLDFRESREPQLLLPYLASAYIGQMAMIGFSFAIHKKYGFVTLATYFITLLAALNEIIGIQ